MIDWTIALSIGVGFWIGIVLAVASKTALQYLIKALERRLEKRAEKVREILRRQGDLIRQYTLPLISDRHADAPADSDHWQVCGVEEHVERTRVCVPSPISILPDMHVPVEMHRLESTPWGELAYGFDVDANVGEIHVLVDAVKDLVDE